MYRFKISLVYFFIIFFSNAKAQISIEILQILNSSSSITYVGINYQPDYYLYQPDFDRIERGLAMRNEMYESAFKIVSHEYRKLQNLKLVNIINSNRLKSFQASVKSWADRDLSKYDLSQIENKNNVLNYITAVYKDKSIMNELQILKFINEFYRSIGIDPKYGKCKKEAYNDINSFIEELKYYSDYQLAQDPSTLFQGFLKKRDQELVNKKDNLYKETLNKYNLLTSFKSIGDGWFDATILSLTKLSLASGVEDYRAYFIGENKVFVEKNKITAYINSEGSVINIDKSSLINKQKADVIIPFNKCDGTVSMVANTIYIF